MTRDARRDPQTFTTDSGAALISVVLILGLLSVFALTISLYVNQRAALMALKRDDVYSHALLYSALNYGAGRILSTPVGRPVIGSDRIRLNSGRATISWSSESGRLDINFAPPDRLATVFIASGLPAEEAARLANVLVMRRTLQPKMPIPNEYRALSGHAVGPFNFVDELKTLPGMTPEIFKFIYPLVTVYGRSDRFDSRIASKSLLNIIFSSAPEELARLEDARALSDDDFRSVIATVPNGPTIIDSKRSPATRLIIDLETVDGRKHRYEIVIISFPDDPSPYRILEWHQI